MESYHHAWLNSHPQRTEQWLRDKLSDGFHIHHVDGNHGNDDPLNLVLIDGADHLMLHAGSIAAGIKWWRKSTGQKGAAALAARRALAPDKPEKKPGVRARPKIKRDGPLVLLSGEALTSAKACVDGGGSVADAARILGQITDLSWKQRMFAIRREVVTA